MEVWGFIVYGFMVYANNGFMVNQNLGYGLTPRPPLQ